MLRIVSCALALAFTACAVSTPATAEAGLEGRPPLDFSGDASTDGWGEDSAFAKSVTARYGGGQAAADLRADAAAQGFQCNTDGTECQRYVMQEACAVSWIIDITPAGEASGRHFMRCMGAEVE